MNYQKPWQKTVQIRMWILQNPSYDVHVASFKIRSLHDLRDSHIPEDLAQVKFHVCQNSARICSTTYVYTMQPICNPKPQHIRNWSAAAWRPHYLCCRILVFFHHLHLIMHSFLQSQNFVCVSKMLFPKFCVCFKHVISKFLCVFQKCYFQFFIIFFWS